MRFGNKGFSLVELMVTVAVLAIVATIGIPSFTAVMNSTKASSETSDLYRALSTARLEAINRSRSVRLAPTSGTAWTGALQIRLSDNTVLRDLPAMGAGGALSATPTSTTYIEFNNLGALAFPASAVVLAYVRGSKSINIGVCLNGRVIQGGTC